MPGRALPVDRLTAVMIGVVLLTLAGGYLLLSAAESLTLVDGAVEWQAESPLRAVVQVLCLNYQFPTINAGDVKGYVLGLGLAVALGALGIFLLAEARMNNGDIVAETPDASDEWSSDPAGGLRTQRGRTEGSLVWVAQFLFLAYLLWSFASGRWSRAPELSLAGSILLLIHVLWAVTIGQTVRGAGLRFIGRGVVAITALTSLIAIWYFYGRNPTLRAKFPFGNPTFLAAALIPAIALAAALLVQEWRHIREGLKSVPMLWIFVAGVGLALALWAFVLTGSRGAQVGLGAAVLACVFLGLRGRARWIPVAMAIALAAGAWAYYSQTAAGSISGRGETIRLRQFAWSYAARLFLERPLTGQGQGGFTLLGDSYVSKDIVDHPRVFDGRIDHAHNEWLEVLADLGLVGGVLLAAALILTFLACTRIAAEGEPERRWWVIGLGGALAGLVIEEAAGVGLRVSEVPVVFYSILGLTWAATQSDLRKLPAIHSRAPRVVLASCALVLALGTMVASQLDFEGARASYRIQEWLAEGKNQDAIEAAREGMWRLSPQRSLSSTYQRADATIQWGERTIRMATERVQRAQSAQPMDRLVMELAHADLAEAEESVRQGGQLLKQLVEWSPAYISSGVLDYRIHLVRAQAATLRGDPTAAEASRKSAVAGLERELLRQPFQADLANAYVQFARPDASVARLMTVLARPLRLNPVTAETASRLEELANAPQAAQIIENSIAQARAESPATNGELVDSRWLPELLRLSASLSFLRGDYERAASVLKDALEEYSRLPRPATLGQSACQLERADALFYAHPEEPSPALAQAAEAIESTPPSWQGRLLKKVAMQRMVQYTLALEDEPAAIALLSQLAPAGTREDVLRQQLGTHLRQLSESLLLHRREALVLRKPADTLIPRLQNWLTRAFELNPREYAAKYLLADLALYLGDADAAAMYLREALDAGLSPADAARFLTMALERQPDANSLKELAATLSQAGVLASDKAGP